MFVRKLEGYGRLSEKQAIVLRMLQSGVDAGFPFQAISVHKVTIDALVRNDFVFRSVGIDGIKYKITSRGSNILKMYEMPVESRRYDGICPTCGIRNRHIYPSGRKYGYCLECESGRRKRQAQMHGYRPKLVKERICPCCKIRMCHVRESGVLVSSCLKCRNEVDRERRPARTAARLAAIAIGDAPKCCKCDEDVYSTERSVYDYCQKHLRIYMNDYNRRRRQ